jgi:ADP-ribose pyrophosphatase YjhB (NUDIX family)
VSGVGVAVTLIDDEQRVLLTLRRRTPEAGCWSILGGKLDFLEKLSDCAVRETREEAGETGAFAMGNGSFAFAGRTALDCAGLSLTRGEWRSAELRAGENGRSAMACHG